MPAQDWPQATDAEQMFRQNEKRMLRQERRPVIQQASDLMGPGVASFAVEVPSWRSPEAAFNGWFWTPPSTNSDAPDTTHYWIGQTTATQDGFGIQRAMTFHDEGSWPPRVAWRQFVNISGVNVNYSTWSFDGLVAHDPLTSSGDAGGLGAWSLNADGTATIPGMTQPHYTRELGTDQSIGGGVNVLITSWSTLIEDAGGWTYSSGVFTCTAAGRWLVVAGAKFDPDTADPSFRRIFITKNGTNNTDAFAQGNAIPRDGGTDTFTQAVGVASFAVGDVVRVYARHSHPSSVTLVAGPGLQAQFQRISA